MTWHACNSISCEHLQSLESVSAVDHQVGGHLQRHHGKHHPAATPARPAANGKMEAPKQQKKGAAAAPAIENRPPNGAEVCLGLMPAGTLPLLEHRKVLQHPVQSALC